MSSLWLDEHVFLRSVRRRLGALVFVVMGGTLVAFLLAGLVGGFRWQILSELFATQVGAVDLDPKVSLSFWGRFLFHLFCVLAFGGLLISILCSAVQSHEDRVRSGLVRYNGLARHYIVVGWSDLTPELVARLLAGEMDAWHPNGNRRPAKGARPRLVLCTSSDVAAVRRELEERLGEDDFRRVVFYFGTIDINESKERRGDGDRIRRVLRTLGVDRARQVFLLADRADPYGRDVKLLALARMISESLGESGKLEERTKLGLDPVLPVFAELDAHGSQDVVQKFPTSPVEVPGGSGARVYFRPFSVHELWASRLFSPDRPAEIRPLLYRTPAKGDSVHLVVVGFTRMGCALVEQALRSCHYPGDLRARITVVDRKPVEEAFRARHPDLDQIRDVGLDFVVGDVASAEIRDRTIRPSAVDPHVMLTVAVCVEDPDVSLSIALNLPREVYQWGMPEKNPDAPHPHRARWKPDGNNVWVRQSLVTGFADALNDDRGRYAWVSPFGMVADVLTPRSFAEHAVMVRGYMYGQHKKSGSRDADAAERLVKELRNDVSHVLDESFSHFLGTEWAHRWANVHAEDTIPTVLAALGLRAVPDRSGGEGADRSAFNVGEGFRERLEANLAVFPATRSAFSAVARKKGFSEDAFAEAEHRRWMADRTLAGFRQIGPGETRDDFFQLHHSFLPFKRIETKNNDRNNILAIPVFLALEGYRIEAADDARGSRSLAGRRTDVVECMA